MIAKRARKTTLVDFNPKAHVCPFCLGLTSEEVPTYEWERERYPVPIMTDKGPKYLYDHVTEVEWIPRYFFWGEARVDPAFIVRVFGLLPGREYVYSNKFQRLLLVEGHVHHDYERWCVVKDPRNGHKYQVIATNWKVSAPGKPPKTGGGIKG